MTIHSDPSAESVDVEISRLRSLALFDEMTGLPNRRAFLQRLEEAFVQADAGGSAFSLVLLDLDGLKDINDTFGYQAGNRALQEFAAALIGALRSEDMVARIGGDEFAVLALHPVVANADAIIRRVRDVARGVIRPIKNDSPPVILSAAVGQGSWCRDSRSVDDLFTLAEAELLAAKVAPPPVVVADGTFRPRGRRALGEELRSLLGMARQVTTSQGIGDLLRRVVEQAAALVGAEIAALAMVQDDGTVRFDEVLQGDGWRSHVSVRPLGKGVLGRTAATGTPEMHTSVSLETHYDLVTTRALGLRTLLSVPLSDRQGTTFGVLALGNKRGGQVFVESDIGLAQAFADLAASAIENVRSYDAAEEARAYQRTLMEQARDAIAVVDPFGGCLLDVNAAMEQISGYHRIDLLRLTIHDLDLASAHVSRLLDDARLPDPLPVTLTDSIRRKHGTRVPVELSASHVQTHRGPRLMVIMRDIEERLEAEAETRRRTEELEARNAVAGLLTESGSVEAALAGVLPVMMRADDLDGAVVMLLDATSHLHMVAGTGLPDDLRQLLTIAPPRVGERLSRRFAAERHPIVINDMTAARGSFWPKVQMAGVESTAVLPLVANDRLLGALGAISFRSGMFNGQRLTRLRAFSDQIAVWLDSRFSLHESQETRDYLQALMRQAGDGIVVTDVESGVVIDVNDRACEMLGLSREQVIGRSPTTLVATAERPIADERFADLRAGNERTMPVRRDLLCADGSTIPIELNVSRVSVGRRTLLVGMVRDLRGRIEAERQVRFQARVLATMRDAVVALDRDGRVVVWNRGAEDLFGWTEAEMLSTLARDAVTGGGLPYLNDLVRRLADEPTATGEVPFERKDGTRMWCHVTLTRMDDEHGNSAGLIGIIRDVTAEHEARAARNSLLRRLAEANEAATRRTVELQAIADVAGILVAGGEPDSVYASLADRILAGSSFDLATIALFDADRQALCLRQIRHRLPYVPERLLAQQGVWIERGRLPIVEQLMAQRSPLVVHDGDALWQASAITRRIAREDQLRLVVTVPLIYNGEFIGTLCLCAREDRDVPAEEIRLLQALADQVATAVHRHTRDGNGISPA